MLLLLTGIVYIYCRGNWMEVGWHMCTSVAGPALLGLPFAMSLLGWPAGVVALLMVRLAMP